jgi:hypothetical protein
MKLKDIPRFTRSATYRIEVSWKYLKEWIRDQQEINLDLDPDFQRNYVWTYSQKSKYVEYMLRGGISGKEIYFNCVGWMGDFKGPFVLVDGKQRISAALDFLTNSLMICKGLYYKDFEDKLSSIEPSFSVNVNDLATRAEVLQWYLDLNTGGTIHTDFELDKVKELLIEETKKTRNGKGNKTIGSRPRTIQ